MISRHEIVFVESKSFNGPAPISASFIRSSLHAIFRLSAFTISSCEWQPAEALSAAELQDATIAQPVRDVQPPWPAWRDVSNVAAKANEA